MKIRCTTLFDITQTNLSNRRKNLEDSIPLEMVKRRNQQINLETLLQIIGLRCQPEDISQPVCLDSQDILWGKSYSITKVKTWNFTFSVGFSAVFIADGDPLGNLKIDCIGVPMITGLDESVDLHRTLDLSIEYKNIHFEVVND